MTCTTQVDHRVGKIEWIASCGPVRSSQQGTSNVTHARLRRLIMTFCQNFAPLLSWIQHPRACLRVAEALPRYNRSIGVSARLFRERGGNQHLLQLRGSAVKCPQMQIGITGFQSDGRCTNLSITREPNPGACSSIA
jgi:hypothetical protein